VTALDRRLEKLEAALSPAEAVVRWLESAKSHGGFGPYCDYLVAHQEESPLLTLPPLVAAWAGHSSEGKDEPAVAAKVERAVRSTLVRVLLVERMNKLVIIGRASDDHQVDLLHLLEPLVLTGRVDAPTTTNWINHAGRLLGEVRLWLESAATIGARYFGGHSPLFPDVEPFLRWERTCCEEMLSRFNDAAARKRGHRPTGEPVDFSLVDEWVAELLEPSIAELVRIASIDAQAFLNERARPIGISHLIELGEAPPWRP
jgi:hypothetical protein